MGADFRLGFRGRELGVTGIICTVGGGRNVLYFLVCLIRDLRGIYFGMKLGSYEFNFFVGIFRDFRKVLNRVIID